MVVSVALLMMGAVGLELVTPANLPAGDRRALEHELGAAIERTTGAAPRPGGDPILSVSVRRIGWRTHVSCERREGGAATARGQLDLTPDQTSWRTPLEELVRTLLPEGRRLAALEVATRPAAVQPARITPQAEPKSVGPLIPVTAAPLSPRPAASPALPPEPVPALEPAGRSKLVPLILIGASIAAGVVGLTQAMRAASAIDEIPTTSPRNIPTQAEVEASQRAIFEGALLGSVLLSVGAGGLVTGTVLLLD
jgi:hypothetical protein